MPSTGKPKADDSSFSSSFIMKIVQLTVLGHAIYFFGIWAYRIRLLAIQEYGPVIHEFDPYFNYRATEYLYRNGWKRFVRWFDYKVWYPLGRPVGTTIYPGMQVTAVFLKNFILGDKMSINDICCYMPAWFGVTASLFTGFLAYECSLPESSSETIFGAIMNIFTGSSAVKRTKITDTRCFYSPAAEVGVFAMGIMSVLPAHLMRSVGGGYDNECVAVTAMTLTFWLWCRSLRADDPKSYVFGALAGVAYFYMAAAWGGYVFVLNMVGAHAGFLVLLKRFSSKLYRSYSLFYLVGTSLAVRVPVIGLTPLKSLEQLGPCAVFLFYQALQVCEILRRRKNLNYAQTWRLRFKVFTIALLLGIAVIYLVAPTGYFGPISARVRGLFVKHTRTGNPLVDSVAEHQPASQRAYFQYLHYLLHIAPLGFALVLLNFGDAPSFLILYGIFAYFFSAKMVRLILLLAPIASALGGVFIGRLFAWCVEQILPWIIGEEKTSKTTKVAEEKQNKQSSKKKKREVADATAYEPSSFEGLVAMKDAFALMSNSSGGKVCKRIVAVISLLFMLIGARFFRDYAWGMAAVLSNPSIVTKARTQSGEVVVVDDYREAYFWLRDHTPKDARVLSWWDYGYQITGISNRTTLADGNTWNHEHIALLGRILTGPEEEGYEMARHLADYVLIWAGGGGDDLAKSPHLARIANSVFRNMCPGDPTCRSFGFMDKYGTPSPMMAKSFLYKLHSHKLKPGVEADTKKFREVYRTRYGKVRIYKILNVSKESKSWIADRRNRKCDVPGSWFCPGQYPPALEPYLSEKKDFGQLEDFNRKTVDEEYQKQYFENLADPRKAREKTRQHYKDVEEQQKQPLPSKSSADDEEDDSSDHIKPTTFLEMKSRVDSFKASENAQDLIDEVYSTYADTEETTLMWKIVTSNAIQDLMNWLSHDPIMAYTRSGDGRGPMWWAYEYHNMEIVEIFKRIGISDRDRDKYGKRPIDLVKRK